MTTKTKRKRVNITGRYASVTQPKIIGWLSLENNGNIFLDDSTFEGYKTPDKVRDNGIIVCSECGYYNSDSLEHCKFCHEPLMYFRSV